MQETFDWFKPSPLWAPNGSDLRQGTFYRPVLLDYATDDFVETFLADAGASSAQHLGAHVLQNDNGRPLKLYQPAHGRFYLLCATLSCRQPGLPDRMVRLVEGETTFYVLRRINGNGEYGWIPEGENPGWQPVGENRRTVLDGEERQPMFRAQAGNQRELRYAYIPTTSRASEPGDFSGVPAEIIDEVIGGPPPDDLRLFELEAQFLAQLSSIDEAQAKDDENNADDELPDTDNAQRLSIYLLIDLWEYLDRYLPATAAHIVDDTSSASLTAEETALLTFLDSTAALILPVTTSLRNLLAEVAPARAVLDQLEDRALPTPFDELRFNLAGWSFSQASQADWMAAWNNHTAAALNSVDVATGREKPQVVLPQVQPDTGEQYVIRCVYERPQCEQIKHWVSHPTALFSLAPLYDPDAPARQINIALPSDISLGALRKFQKGATFVMSQALRDKLKQVPLVKMTNDEANVSGISLSYICSFSIPIITICAFILLLIIVIVLNFVFWWLPFLKICFPIPRSAE